MILLVWRKESAQLTLVISKVSRRFVIQVSDRLLTSYGSQLPFDTAANKSIIYFARDAYVAISYSGLAYLEGIPTDEWIGRVLSGDPWDVPCGGPGGHFGTRIQAGQEIHAKDIGLSIRLLRDQLAAVMQSEPAGHRQYAPQVTISGWQRGKRAWRPILYYLCDLGEGSYYTGFGWSRRHGWERGMFYLDFVPRRNPLFPSEVRELDDRFKQPHTEEGARVLIGDYIRRAADRSLVVGRDYLSILLPPPGARFIETRYVANGASSSIHRSDELNIASALGSKRPGPVAYSPWVIAPGFVRSPSLLIGSSSFPIGDFTVNTLGPEGPTGRTIFLVLSQHRPTPRGTQRRSAAEYLQDASASESRLQAVHGAVLKLPGS